MFFQDIDSISLLERNSAKLEGLELNQIRKLVKMYKQARQEIMANLLFSSDNTFTEARLASTLEQINQMITVLESRLNSQLQFGFDTLTEQGIEDSAKEINAFEKHFNGVTGLIPVDAILESTKPENFLFNQYQASIQTYNQGLRNEFQRVLGQSLLQQKTWTQTVNDMEGIFALEEWRLARIVRTELHQIYNVSKLNGFLTVKDEYLPDLQKTLYHPMDSRTGQDSISMAKANLIVDFNEPFIFTHGKKTYKFMTPPNRPNDRAILIPYRSDYEKKV